VFLISNPERRQLDNHRYFPNIPIVPKKKKLKNHKSTDVFFFFDKQDIPKNKQKQKKQKKNRYISTKIIR